MATIAKTLITGSGQRVLTETTLTGTADTFVYQQGVGMVLLLRNPTGGALSPTIDGADGTTVEKAGLGSVSVAGGYAVGSIAAGAARAIPLDSISDYLQGEIAITSGTGLVGALLSEQ